MRTSLVLTVIGDDRPGIVEELSSHILAADANWEESRIAHLAGKCAGLLRVSVDEDRADALEAALLSMANRGLTTVVERSKGSAPSGYRTLSLNMLGNDQPGIIRDISRLLVSHQVNIMELETDVESAAMSGEALFRAHAILRIPPGVSPGQLRSLLETLAHELMVDLAVEQDERAAAS